MEEMEILVFNFHPTVYFASINLETVLAWCIFLCVNEGRLQSKLLLLVSCFFPFPLYIKAARDVNLLHYSSVWYMAQLITLDTCQVSQLTKNFKL